MALEELPDGLHVNLEGGHGVLQLEVIHHFRMQNTNLTDLDATEQHEVAHDAQNLTKMIRRVRNAGGCRSAGVVVFNSDEQFCEVVVIKTSRHARMSKSIFFPNFLRCWARG